MSMPFWDSWVKPKVPYAARWSVRPITLHLYFRRGSEMRAFMDVFDAAFEQHHVQWAVAKVVDPPGPEASAEELFIAHHLYPKEVAEHPSTPLYALADPNWAASVGFNVQK